MERPQTLSADGRRRIRRVARFRRHTMEARCRLSPGHAVKSQDVSPSGASLQELPLGAHGQRSFAQTLFYPVQAPSAHICPSSVDEFSGAPLAHARGHATQPLAPVVFSAAPRERIGCEPETRKPGIGHWNYGKGFSAASPEVVPQLTPRDTTPAFSGFASLRGFPAKPVAGGGAAVTVASERSPLRSRVCLPRGAFIHPFSP